MAYVDTVLSLPLARNRGGRPITEATRERRAAAASKNVRADREQDGEGETRLPGALLEPGQEGGARLMRTASGWTWDFAVRDAVEKKLRVRDSVKPKSLIPPLRIPPEPLTVDTTTSLEYLRQMCSKYEHLGLDELVGPELVAAADEACEPDHYMGSAFRVVHQAHARVASSLLLCKGGELGNDLHVAVFAPKSNKIVRGMPLVRFIASSRALERFPTEILQLDTSQAAKPSERYLPETTMIVRSHSTTHLFALNPDKAYAGSPDTHPASISHLASLPSSATEGRRHMDIALHPKEFGRVAVVDDQGAVWIWRVTKTGEHDLQLVRPAKSVKRGGFYRISWGTRPETLVVLSAGEMVAIDLEDPSFPTTSLLQLPASSSFLGIDKNASDRDAEITCVLSTEEVIWMDEENPGQSTLRWRHEMGHLAGLTVKALPQATHECFMLYSHASPTLLIFHISSSTPIRLLCRPYPVQLPIDHAVPIDYAVIDLQRNTDRPSDLRLLASAPDGSVSGMSVAIGDDEEEEGPVATRWKSKMRRIWDHGLDMIADKGPVESLPEDGMDKRPAARMTYDARWAWDAISAEPEGDDGLSAQNLARYMRELDAPSAHLMTGAELARDALLSNIDHQEPTLRTHNLHHLHLLAMADPAEELAAIDQVDLATDLVPVSQHPLPGYMIDGHTTHAVNGMVEIHRLLTDTYLPDSDTVGPQLKEAHEREARHIASLAADLSLSMRIVSSDPIPAPTSQDASAQAVTSPEDVLVQAARLTLDEKTAPDVKLFYLKPTEPFDRDDTATLPRPTIQMPTVQNLLSEWKVGTEPEEYEWKSWLSPANGEAHSTTTGTQTHARHIRPLPSPRGSPRPSQSQYAAPVFDPTASRATVGVPTLSSQSQLYRPTNAVQAVPYSLPSLPSRKGVPSIVSHSQTQRLASPRPSPPPSPNPAYTPGPGRATNVSPTIRRQAARSPETSTGALAISPAQQWAATQVERGPFGGRPVVGADKKKKPKKRLGGF